MRAKLTPRKAPCPRCKFGFIIFEGTFDGESTCLNCGYHPPELGPVRTWLSEIADTLPAAPSGPTRPAVAPLPPARKVA